MDGTEGEQANVNSSGDDISKPTTSPSSSTKASSVNFQVPFNFGSQIMSDVTCNVQAPSNGSV